MPSNVHVSLLYAPNSESESAAVWSFTCLRLMSWSSYRTMGQSHNQMNLHSQLVESSFIIKVI